jgi:branched-subunit amino acid aminotransferase/4-amino-4-deoxychorismate lyase
MNEIDQNPAFLYGESIFTTCKVESGSIIELKEHINKLLSDARSYYFLTSTSLIRTKINDSIPKLKCSGAFRISISAPKREGLICDFHEADMIVSVSFRELDLSLTKPARLKMAKRVQDDKLCDFKIGSYGKELYLKRLAMIDGFDDVLFFGEGKIFETSTSNIFCKKGNTLFTPRSGIYKGLTRSKIINTQNTVERDISIDEILNNEFDEIFLCNSIYERVIVEGIE